MRRRCNGYGMEIQDKSLIEVQQGGTARATCKPGIQLDHHCVYLIFAMQCNSLYKYTMGRQTIAQISVPGNNYQIYYISRE